MIHQTENYLSNDNWENMFFFYIRKIEIFSYVYKKYLKLITLINNSNEYLYISNKQKIKK